MVKSGYIGDGHPTFNRNPYTGYINPYYWVDDHPLLYGIMGVDRPHVDGMRLDSCWVQSGHVRSQLLQISRSVEFHDGLRVQNSFDKRSSIPGTIPRVAEGMPSI